MGREIKRVPLDFHWPLRKVWKGYNYYDNCKCDKFVPYNINGRKYYDNCDIVYTDKCPYYYSPPSGVGYQIWETISEGSPITPVFKTKEDLIDYIVNNGLGGMFSVVSRETAIKFVDDEGDEL